MKLNILWGGGLFCPFCPRGQGGGHVECPRLSTRGGEGVKIGSKLVHVVVECPLTMMNDGEDLWQKTKINFQVTVVKIDEIYDIWDISSVILNNSMSTFYEILMLVQSDIPQLQRHALWTLANFTRQENSKTSFSSYRLTFIFIHNISFIN